MSIDNGGRRNEESGEGGMGDAWVSGRRKIGAQRRLKMVYLCVRT